MYIYKRVHLVTNECSMHDMLQPVVQSYMATLRTLLHLLKDQLKDGLKMQSNVCTCKWEHLWNWCS